MLTWRILPYLCCVFFALGCRPATDASDEQDWKTYKTRFIAAEGRVIDTGNGGVSHSEGQGYGLLLAVEHADRETFDRLWQWTRANLQVRNDRLFIWRRRPNVDLKDEDHNNASDGDILIAWALFKAQSQWQQAEYRAAAAAILDDIKHKLLISRQGLTLLLPGEQGFVKEDGLTVNLSYWIYPALQTFASEDPDPIWRQLSDSGLTLLQQARFGRWQLPPDWLRLTAANALEPANDKRFGYDAVRIPLYLALASMEPQTLTAFAQAWRFYQGYTPAWIALNENIIDGYGASVGIDAVKRLALSYHQQSKDLVLPALSNDQDYYSSTLLLLSKLSARTR